MFPEHVERSFLDPEYSFDEYFQLGSRNIRPIKNELNVHAVFTPEVSGRENANLSAVFTDILLTLLVV